MLTRDDVLQELEREAQTTRRALERVPDDKLEWRPHEKSFTLGVLAMHVATIPGAIAGMSTHESFDITKAVPRPSAASARELVETLDRSVAEAKRIVGGMDDAALAAPWRSTTEAQRARRNCTQEKVSQSRGGTSSR